ncbi:MAG: LemA family protein [Deltaproteobacteria bacterium]|jgi:LemA protein|nr:LemA family protein [Deltaproteobacteria bacterium]
MLAVVFVLLAIAAAIAILATVTYNRLVRSDNERKRALAQIDVQLKRRSDLIPNLVESARGYLAHESSTLDEVITARTVAAGLREASSDSPRDSNALGGLFAADTALTGVLGKLMMVAENYPDLKANGTVSDLMNELNNTETQISGSRSAYNNAVKEYNQDIELFPNVLFSSIFGFKKAASWALTDPAEAVPVRFSLVNKP